MRRNRIVDSIRLYFDWKTHYKFFKLEVKKCVNNTEIAGTVRSVLLLKMHSNLHGFRLYIEQRLPLNFMEPVIVKIMEKDMLKVRVYHYYQKINKDYNNL